MANVTSHRVNNFDALRLLGALLVLVGHSYPLHGREEDTPVMWGTSFSTLGLMIFFSLSGYLIATSWHREPRFGSYLAKRALRIFPALVVLTLGSAFVLGPVVSTLSVSEYFGSPVTWHYLSNAILSPYYALPGVFQELPYVGTVNGSLWSLPVEFLCYLMVPVVAFAPRRIRSALYFVLAAAFTVTAVLMAAEGLDVVFYGTSLAQATSVWPYFMVGAALATAGDRIPLRLDFAMVAVIAASLVSAVEPTVGRYVWTLVIPYAVIVLGSAHTPVVARAGRFGDFSYGIYLYAFPIQQLVIHVFPSLPFASSTLLTIVATGAMAIASWHLIEKQALKFKPRATEPRAPAPESESIPEPPAKLPAVRTELE